MKIRKSLLATAIAAALGGGGTAASAAVITGQFGFADDDGCGALSNQDCVPIDFGAGPIGPGVFTSGFLLDPDNPDSPRFLPNITDSLRANISADGAMATMTWDTKPFFGGVLEEEGVQGEQLFPATSLTVTALTVTEVFDLTDVTSLTVTEQLPLCKEMDRYACFGIVSYWKSRNTESGLTADWRLKGVAAVDTGAVAAAEGSGKPIAAMALFDWNDDKSNSSLTVPEPPTAWLFGAGLAGLAARLVGRRKAKKS